MTDTRAAFERHFQLSQRQANKDNSGEYVDELVRLKWEGWQAAMAIPQPERKPAAYACIVDGAWLGAWKHEIDAKEAGFSTEKRFDLLPLYFSEEIYSAMDARRAKARNEDGALQETN